MAYYQMIQRGGLGLVVPNCDPTSPNYDPVSCIPANAPIATPPIASDQSDTYTLPVEVFSQTVPVIVPVTSPQPSMAPIPTELPVTPSVPVSAETATHLSIGLILALAAGLLLTLPGRKK